MVVALQSLLTAAPAVAPVWSRGRGRTTFPDNLTASWLSFMRVTVAPPWFNVAMDVSPEVANAFPLAHTFGTERRWTWPLEFWSCNKSIPKHTTSNVY